MPKYNVKVNDYKYDNIYEKEKRLEEERVNNEMQFG